MKDEGKKECRRSRHNPLAPILPLKKGEKCDIIKKTDRAEGDPHGKSAEEREL
jgi:hypothetical protein